MCSVYAWQLRELSRNTLTEQFRYHEVAYADDEDDAVVTTSTPSHLHHRAMHSPQATQAAATLFLDIL